ncbi:hypothetical protein PIB30_034801 [Stylosanthes scabra]|uniref:Uncharacterized protein n=1 Tax=Stylosanthes scabra TaxID=79078 RepID=A0ABU6TF35_9FABA|nr:hypothetical protein [Stylosanthes scabra]
MRTAVAGQRQNTMKHRMVRRWSDEGRQQRGHNLAAKEARLGKLLRFLEGERVRGRKRRGSLSKRHRLALNSKLLGQLFDMSYANLHVTMEYRTGHWKIMIYKTLKNDAKYYLYVLRHGNHIASATLSRNRSNGDHITGGLENL